MSIKIIKMEDEHLDAVLDLLQTTFSDVSKNNYFSRDFLLWKHFNNPHGKSVIYVAVTDDNKIVGFRSFMSWCFGKSSNNYKCFRPVDSAVHPDYRSHGLFKKLTFHILEQIDDYDFIFNNPNENSFPIYTKDSWGWIHDSNVNFSIYISIPSILFLRKRQASNNKSLLLSLLDNNEYTSLLSGTFFNNDYICWRYIKNPSVEYIYTTFDDMIFFVFRLDTRYGLKELRLMDVLVPKENHDSINNVTLNYFDLCKFIPYEFDYLLVTRDTEAYVQVEKSIRISPRKPFIKIATRSLDKSISDLGINISMRDLELF
ncbi:TPA: GNAT family N-acetyltransferase [Vibrio cholerae]|nr:GNAT family N-acetyltransferase [Vibrio cholerae]